MYVQALTGMLLEVCKNPKSPGFNHYLFESVAALIKHGTAADPTNLIKFEDTLFGPFDVVLQQDVQEFHPYVFQILAQLIELNTPPLRQVMVGSLWTVQQVDHGGSLAGRFGCISNASCDDQILVLFSSQTLSSQALAIATVCHLPSLAALQMSHARTSAYQVITLAHIT